MTIIEAREVHVWTAHPGNIDEAQWPGLTAWLDSTERLRAQDFRMQADRRAYVLAHALRRLALATALAVDSSDISFACEASGKPVLTAPLEQDIYFSHAHHRDLVVCATTRMAPVGIDVESLEGGNADLKLLSGFVALSDARRREIELGSDLSRQFFLYWTVLEAYWKAKGTGLSSANPPIHCEKIRPGWFEVSLASGGASRPCALAILLNSPPDCMVTLVLDQLQADAPESELEIHYHDPDFSGPWQGNKALSRPGSPSGLRTTASLCP